MNCDLVAPPTDSRRNTGAAFSACDEGQTGRADGVRGQLFVGRALVLAVLVHQKVVHSTQVVKVLAHDTLARTRDSRSLRLSYREQVVTYFNGCHIGKQLSHVLMVVSSVGKQLSRFH